MKTGMTTTSLIAASALVLLALPAEAKDGVKRDKYHEVGNTRIVYLKTGLSAGESQAELARCCGPAGGSGTKAEPRVAGGGRTYHRMRDSKAFSLPE